MEKIKNRTTIINITTISVLLLCFVSLAVFVKLNLLNGLDSWVYQNCAINIRNTGLNYFFKFVTYFGNFFVLTILCCLLLFFKNKRVGIFTFLNLLVASVLSFLIKHIVRRPRPDVAQLIKETSFSFPSAHAFLSVAVLGLLLYFCFKLLNKKSIKIVLSICVIAIILLVGYSRIYLGVHHFSDIIAGWLLGVCLVLTQIEFVKLYEFRHAKLTKNKL